MNRDLDLRWQGLRNPTGKTWLSVAWHVSSSRAGGPGSSDCPPQRVSNGYANCCYAIFAWPLGFRVVPPMGTGRNGLSHSARETREPADPTAANTPWPLADVEPRAAEPGKLPWRALGTAAGALLTALVVNPLALTHPETGALGTLLGPGLAEAVGWSVTAGMALLFLATLVAAVVAMLPAADRTSLVLKPGGRLGNGPYRSYGCAPSPGLVEGIVASVETAGLAGVTSIRDGTPRRTSNCVCCR